MGIELHKWRKRYAGVVYDGNLLLTVLCQNAMNILLIMRGHKGFYLRRSAILNDIMTRGYLCSAQNTRNSE